MLLLVLLLLAPGENKHLGQVQNAKFSQIKKAIAIIHRNTRKGAMKNDNGQQLSLTQALDLLKNKQGKNFKTADVNLAKLERLTGILIDNLLR